jgi:hypothetical protein
MDDNTLKGPSQVTNYHNSIELANMDAVSEKHGTHSDEKDMHRMGKIPELRVRSDNLTPDFQCTYRIISDNSNFFPSSGLLLFLAIRGNIL